MQELWDKYKRCNIHLMRIPKDEARKEVIFEAIMTQKVSLINVRHQTTDTGSSDNTKQGKCQKNYSQAYHVQTTENQR